MRSKALELQVLDMCAAPGSKTAQLIEMIHAEEGSTLPSKLRRYFHLFLFFIDLDKMIDSNVSIELAYEKLILGSQNFTKI